MASWPGKRLPHRAICPKPEDIGHFYARCRQRRDVEDSWPDRGAHRFRSGGTARGQVLVSPVSAGCIRRGNELWPLYAGALPSAQRYRTKRVGPGWFAQTDSSTWGDTGSITAVTMSRPQQGLGSSAGSAHASVQYLWGHQEACFHQRYSAWPPCSHIHASQAPGIS